jgi:hypothetical protein
MCARHVRAPRLNASQCIAQSNIGAEATLAFFNNSNANFSGATVTPFGALNSSGVFPQLGSGYADSMCMSIKYLENSS